MNPALRRSAAHVFVGSVDAPHLDDTDAHHLLRVLRLRAGEQVSVSDGHGSWRLCSLAGGGELEPVSAIAVEPASAPAITIGFAIPKGDRPEWIVQKLTEIGVDRILLLHTDRGIVRWDGDRTDRHLAKLTRVAREAAMQSRRVHLPVVSGPHPAIPDTLVGVGVGVGVGVALAEPGGEAPTLERPTVLIGPEGGWSDDELLRADAQVGLGPSILRVETAALVVAARLVALRAG